VWVRTARSQRSVHAVRDGGEHCASPEWRSAVAVNLNSQQGVASKASLGAHSAQPTERTRST
ncbi:hypothetical protein ACKE2Y_11170, partial [Yersinia enterocolitica]